MGLFTQFMREAYPNAKVTWFHVSYFDDDWNELEELRLEDATLQEALTALMEWMQTRKGVDAGVLPPTLLLAQAVNLDVEASYEP